MLGACWKRNVLDPLLVFSEQGMEAESIALSVALGLVLGVFPVFGCPTIFCALAALTLGLSLPAIQCINYLVYPLQFVLLVPFIRLGNWLFRSPTQLPGISGFLTSALHAVVAWFFVCAPAGLLLYAIVLVTLRRCRGMKTARQRSVG
jgi:uncharacterized protein (DUF2062 family)